VSQKRRPKSHPNHERWLVSYADFITLLFAFFVVMFASSQVDKGKIGKLAVAIQFAFKDLGIFSIPSSKIPPTTTGPTQEGLPAITSLRDPSSMTTLAQLQKRLEQELEDEIRRGDVAMKVGREGLVISLRELGFFDSGSAEVEMKSEPSVARIAKVLKAGPYYIRIEGHTDNVPIHTDRFASNWELSTARATEMTKLFITRYEFPPERLSAAGYGEFHPVGSNETREGRALNRRVDIVISVVSTKPLPGRRSDAATNPRRAEASPE
jgi:chemotaxis protein MotB